MLTRRSLFGSPPVSSRSFSIAEFLGLGILFSVALLFFFSFPALAQTNLEGLSTILPTQLSLPQGHGNTFRQTPDMVFGLFIGVLLTASIYLFFIWVILRDRGQAFLMLLLLCLAINMASTNDSMMGLLNVYNENMRDLLQSYSMILAYFFGLFFTYYFLEVDANVPPMKLPIVFFAGVLGLLLVMTTFNPQPVHFLLPTLGTLSISIILLTGLGALRIGASGAMSHITAFLSFLAGSLALPLYDLGYITHMETAKTFSYIGFSLAALMFAIVIAGQFAARQEEKERELATSNERFSLAVRGSNEGLFDWNAITGEIYISDQFLKIADVPREKLTRRFKGWLRCIHPSDRALVLRALRKLKDAKGTSTVSFDLRLLHATGETCWLHVKIIGVKEYNTRHFGRLVGSIGDITSRKRSEAELRASEIRFRSITEAHPVPVLIAKLSDGHILYASPGAEILLGLPSGTLTSHYLSRFIPHISERERLTADMSHGKEVDMMEVSVARGDGEPIPVALSARSIHYRNEAAMVIGLYDLTERKQAEKQIAQQQEALQQSEKMAALGGLLAGVAHELNNPLSVVMGQTTLLIEGQEDTKIKGRAEKIFKAADRCSRIVKSFLALARRKPPEHTSVNIAEIIQSSLELLGYQLRNANVTLTLEIQENIPPIIGDMDQLTQVIINLAMNATQAMQEWQGPHQLTIQAGVDPDDDKNILVSIIDTGPGVPPDLQKKIFEPFFTTKGGTGGTGVGLALCLNIVAGHGGQMILENTPGGGATFRIRLPILSANEKTVTETTSEQASTTGRYSLLLVDDEVELAQTLADLLEPAGHDIDLAANGAIALDKLRKKKFDAIISDLRMPVLDGPGLYAALKQEIPEYTNKIIYVTGDTLSTHVNQFLKETPVPVIEKPYRLADVQSALVKLLKENESRSNMDKGDSTTPSSS